MTKQDFLTKLERLLTAIPERERKDILYDYEEHFVSGTADGKSEAEKGKCDEANLSYTA